MPRKKENIRRFQHKYLPPLRLFLFIYYPFLSEPNTAEEYPTVARWMSMLLVLRILTLGYP